MYQGKNYENFSVELVRPVVQKWMDKGFNIHLIQDVKIKNLSENVLKKIRTSIYILAHKEDPVKGFMADL